MLLNPFGGNRCAQKIFQEEVKPLLDIAGVAFTLQGNGRDLFYFFGFKKFHLQSLERVKDYVAPSPFYNIPSIDHWYLALIKCRNYMIHFKVMHISILICFKLKSSCFIWIVVKLVTWFNANYAPYTAPRMSLTMREVISHFEDGEFSFAQISL